MSKKLLNNEAAEREANDVAFRFMNSSDVVGDMRRSYSGRLDRVRLHDDASADAKVSAAGRDGIASGEDIYLKKGMLSDQAPEAKGLIAHEMTHIMQQSGDAEGAGMQESVSYGEEQGGLKDFFSGLFGKKKKPLVIPENAPSSVKRKYANEAQLSEWADSMTPQEIASMQISEPVLQKAVYHQRVRGVTDEQVAAQQEKLAESGGSFEESSKLENMFRETRSADFSQVSAQDRPDELIWQDFISPNIGMEIGRVNRQLAHDPKIQQRALNEFLTSKGGAMRKLSSQSEQMTTLRNDPGMEGVSHVLAGLLPEGFIDKVYQTGKTGTQGIDTAHMAQVWKDKTMMADELAAKGPMNDTQKMSAASEQGLSQVKAMVGDEDSEVADYLTRMTSVFDGTKIDTDDLQSQMMMNVLMNRVVTPAISGLAGNETDDSTRKGIQQYSQWMMKSAEIDKDASPESQSKKHGGFMSSLVDRIRKRKSGGRSRSGTVFSSASILQ